MSIEENNPYKRTHLVIVAIVVALITGGNIWLSRGETPLGFNRFENYGIAIDYKQDMSLERLWLDGRPLAESAGNIQASRQGGDSIEQFGVLWLEKGLFPSGYDASSEGFLDYVFDMVKGQGESISDRMRFKTFEKGGVEIVMDSFTVNVSGVDVPGVIGSWYCEESDRFIQLYLIQLSDVDNPAANFVKLEDSWKQYYNSLKCH